MMRFGRSARLARLWKFAITIARLTGAACLLSGAIALEGHAQTTSALRVFGVTGYRLSPQRVAIVINEDDPRSVEIGEYYRIARKIPAANVVRVSIPGSPSTLAAEQFEHLNEAITKRLSDQIDVIVLVWTTPYAVECNSITSAITLGFDAKICQASCAPSKPSLYFNSNSLSPFADFGMRLAMLLPVQSIEQAKALIDRGVRSDHTFPRAGAYFLTTSDAARSSRAPLFPQSGTVARRALTIHTLRADSIEDKHDIMIYQTGLFSVPKLETLSFLPGALADHLTSAGGVLLQSSQMSSLHWLEAGATASYGTVSEPCNHWQKFPHPAILLGTYLAGASAIEAYWKSVAWPSQGVFIGEPLASPYHR